MDECARIMLTEVERCNSVRSALEKVIFVLYSQKDFDTFFEEKEWIERRETLKD